MFSNRFMYVGSRSNHSCGCNDAIYQLSFSVSHVRGVWYCCTWGSNGLISSVIGTCWVYLGMADLLTFVEWSSTVDGFEHLISYSQFIAFRYYSWQLLGLEERYIECLWRNTTQDGLKFIDGIECEHKMTSDGISFSSNCAFRTQPWILNTMPLSCQTHSLTTPRESYKEKEILWKDGTTKASVIN